MMSVPTLLLETTRQWIRPGTVVRGFRPTEGRLQAVQASTSSIPHSICAVVAAAARRSFTRLFYM